MIKNQFIVAWRRLLRNRKYSVINLLGLTLGITACLVITIYVVHELSYDKFFADADRIYRVTMSWEGAADQPHYATSPPPLKSRIQSDIPEVEASVRLFRWSDFTMRPDHDHSRVFRETNVFIAGPELFSVLDFGWLAGNPETALKDIGNLVLPKSTAIKYFGEEAFEKGEILNRNILIGKDGGTPARITGIIEDLPTNSHLQYDMLISESSFQDIISMNIWSWPVIHTYIKLREGASVAEVEAKLEAIVQLHAIPDMEKSGNTFSEAGDQLNFSLQPITRIHLHSNLLREIQPNGNYRYVFMFILVAVFILLIACINYMNLATAQSLKRAREVGLRKMFGANRRELGALFMTESIIFVGVACAISLVFAEIMQGYFSEVLGEKLSFSISHNPWVIWLIPGIILVTGILSGSYPAFYLTRFQPVEALKNRFKTAGKGNYFLRNGLVIFQFTVSIILISGAIIAMDQLSFIQSHDLGFNKSQVLVIQNDKEIDEVESRKAFRQHLLSHSSIQEVSFASGIPALQEYHMRDFRMKGETDGIGMHWFQSDAYYPKAMDLQMVEGTWFEENRSSDSSAVIINEAARRALGLTEATGKTIVINQGAEDEREVIIKGVCKNFHYESFSYEVKPLIIEHLNEQIFKDYITIKLTPGKEREASDFIAGTWKEFEPGVPLTSFFMDQHFDRLFRAEGKLSRVFVIFSLLAIAIACMGLLGLAAFNAENRQKEISIRKVVGADIRDILVLLTKNYSFLILISMVIAIPIAWFILDQWLSNFAYRIDISPFTFLLAGALVILIALLTVLGQSVKAALTNPVESLRNE